MCSYYETACIMGSPCQQSQRDWTSDHAVLCYLRRIITIPIYIQYLVVFEKLNLVFVEVLSVQNFTYKHISDQHLTITTLLF